MSLRSILFHVVQLNIDTLALIVVLEVVSVLRWLFQGLLVLFKRVLIWLLLHRLVFLIDWLLRLRLMDPGDEVLIWGGCVAKLEARVFIVWVTDTDTEHCLWDTLQVRNVTDVDVCLGRTHVERQFEDSTVEFIVHIEHVYHCPSIAYILVS